jgi:hypothetical protein
MKEVSCAWDVKKMCYTGTCKVVEDAVQGSTEKEMMSLYLPWKTVKGMENKV